MTKWILGTLLTCLVAVLAPIASQSAAAVAPQHTLQVSGADVGMFPAFTRSVSRYAVTSGAETAGVVTVTATTTDPDGEVRVNGRVAVDGRATVSGLEEGDEIAVFVEDSAGVARYSLVFLPAGFPELERVTPAAEGITPGHVLLTLGLWTRPSRFYETAVDDNGVPAYVVSNSSSLDFKRHANGHYTVARSTGDARGNVVVELDERMQEVRRHRSVGLVHTDGHDFQLRDDGSAYVLSYEPDGAGLTDAVVQHVSPTGEVLFQWDSSAYVDETVLPDSPDYAHINSVEVLDDGHLLMSFRHLSAIFKVARYDDPGGAYRAGDVLWKLGGRDSDFTFEDETGSPETGPCAQHTAVQLDNGNIVAFDNGAWNLNPLCVDPEDPTGDPVARTPTRIAEWELDHETGVATMVRDVQIGNRYAIFAGSAQPLADGNIMIGWASANQQALATEVDAQDRTVWELRAVEAPQYFTYRAYRQEVPDRIEPEATIVSPAPGAEVPVGSVVSPVVECSDRGGSSLVACDADPVDTLTPGVRTVTVTARDGAGNVTRSAHTYTVVGPATPTPAPPVPSSTPVPTPPAPAPVPAAEDERLPDLHARSLPRGRWKGEDVHDVRRGQVLRRSAYRRSAVRVRVQNDGSVADRFRLRVRSRGEVVSPGWADRTRRTPLLAPGESWSFRLVVRRGRALRRTDVRIVARSVGDLTARDRVWTRTSWR